MDLDKIEKLADLKERGLITEEEYAAAKAKILSAGNTGELRRAFGDMDNHTYSMLLHFSQLCGFVAPVFGWIVPLVMWAIKRDDPYIDQQGKVVLNWILSFFIYLVISLILMTVFIGVLLLIVLAISSVIFIVLGAIRANDGVIRNYPLSIEFFTVTPTGDGEVE